MSPQPRHLQPGEVLLLGETDAEVEAGKSLVRGDVHRVLVNTWWLFPEWFTSINSVCLIKKMFEVEDYLSTSSSAEKLLIEKIEGHYAEQKVKKLSTTSSPTAPTLPLSLSLLLWIWPNVLFQFSLPTCEDLCSRWHGTYYCAEQSPRHDLQWYNSYFLLLSKYQTILLKPRHSLYWFNLCHSRILKLFDISNPTAITSPPHKLLFSCDSSSSIDDIVTVWLGDTNSSKIFIKALQNYWFDGWISQSFIQTN